MNPPSNIVLTGFMGSGKSTVGRILAERLGWEFVDTDAAIERKAGKTIARIFEEAGEPAFRALETEFAATLPAMERAVVATGGGFPVRAENLAHALAAGAAVFLVASPDRIWQRVGRETHRPLLNAPDPRARIAELLEARSSAYAAIPLRIPTDDRTPEEVADEILDTLGLR